MSDEKKETTNRWCFSCFCRSLVKLGFCEKPVDPQKVDKPKQA